MGSTFHIAVLDFTAEEFLGYRREELFNSIVFCDARRPKLVEVIVENFVLLGRVDLLTLEAAHPDAIANYKMVKCAVNALKKSRSSPLALLIGKSSANSVKPAVCQCIVPSEHLEVSCQHSEGDQIELFV